MRQCGGLPAAKNTDKLLYTWFYCCGGITLKAETGQKS